MREISDLTKDTRPSLKTILLESTHDIIELDKKQENTSGEYLEIENQSFYYRVIYLFMSRSVLYYTKEEVDLWSKKELLKEVTLPQINGFDLDSLN